MTEWVPHPKNVDNYMDEMIQSLKDNPEVGVEAFMIANTVGRAYLQWVHSAQASGIDPHAVRDSTLNIVGWIILELTGRMGSIGPDGNRMSAREWVHDFMQELVYDLSKDINTWEKKRGLNS